MRGLIRPNQPIALASADEPDWNPSLVHDLDEGREIVVGVPYHGDHEVRVEPGSVVNVQTTHPDGLRVFACRVLGREEGERPTLRLSWPDAVQRLQRRSYVRVEVSLDLEVRVVGAGGSTGPALRGRTLDLSAGGVRFALAEELLPGSRLDVRLYLPQDPPVECAARLVRRGEGAARAEHAAGEGWWAAVEFTGISPEVRRALTRFVFAVQQDQMSREVA